MNKVIVLLPNARRQTVKVSPNKTILEVLEEACQKHDLSVEDFSLKHHNRVLDLTQMFRFTGLPNNCLLEMVESTQKRIESDVILCLQLEDGSRPQETFNPAQTLLEILTKLCPEEIAVDRHPVAIYMRKEIYGESLGKTTLKTLGITSGRAVIRYINKNPDELKTQANVYVAPAKVVQTSTDESRINASSAANPADGSDLLKTIVQIKNEKSEKSETETNSQEPLMDVGTSEEDAGPSSAGRKYDWGTSGNTLDGKIISQSFEQDLEDSAVELLEIESEIHMIGERNAVLFSLNEAQRVPNELPDAFFELTVHDLQYLLRDLKRQTNDLNDTPLLTSKLRELEDSKRVLNKLGQYKKSVIRVQFPNRLVLQGTFAPVETIQDVEDFVRNYLQDPKLEFHLFTIPPKKILSSDITLIESDCVPTALLHFGLKGDQIEELLKPELLFNLTSPNGAIVAASRARGVTCPKSVKNDQSIDENRPGPSTGAIPKQPKVDTFKLSSATQPSAGQVPKWFKPTGK